MYASWDCMFVRSIALSMQLSSVYNKDFYCTSNERHGGRTRGHESELKHEIVQEDSQTLEQVA